MAKIISYKAKITETGETRRFTVDEQVRSSFVKFQDKLKQLFPELNTKKFGISWNDLDGDTIAISSDEELMIAIGDMKEPVFNIAFKVDRKKASAGNYGKIHPGIVCDGCDGSVVGTRYKCLVCYDFDLCAVCEAKGIHPVHDMLEIKSPLAGQFFSFESPRMGGHHGMKRMRCMPKMSRRPNGCWRGPKLDLDECMGTSAWNFTEADRKNVKKYMTKIESMLNTVVDAFFMDDTADTKSSKTPDSNKEPKEETKEKEGEATPTEQVDQAPKTSESTNQMDPDLSKSSGKNGENRDCSVDVNEVPPRPTPMNQAETGPAEEGAVALDPRIQVARQAMLNMGFNDEGGWLTTLIKAKDGDIAGVLGALQAAKKQ